MEAQAGKRWWPRCRASTTYLCPRVIGMTFSLILRHRK